MGRNYETDRPPDCYLYMNLEEVYDYCKSIKGAEEALFRRHYVVFRIMGKIFMQIYLPQPDRIQLKCEPDFALDLRDKYRGIEPGWHTNERHWNTVILHSDVEDAMIMELIDLSVQQVLKTLPKKVCEQYAVGLKQ